jgi:hypothetical protein
MTRVGATPSSARRLKPPHLCIDDELKACWLSSIASTLLLWARQHATRKNVSAPDQRREDSKRTDLTQFTPGYSRGGTAGPDLGERRSSRRRLAYSPSKPGRPYGPNCDISAPTHRASSAATS